MPRPWSYRHPRHRLANKGGGRAIVLSDLAASAIQTTLRSHRLATTKGHCRRSLSGAAHRRVSRRIAAGCLIAPIALLIALAYADPPDPSWIPGICDDAGPL